jgi:hypothetical protein
MNEKEIAELNMYCGTNSILIVTNKRRLVRLRCPFMAEVTSDIYNLKKGDTVNVDAVKLSRDVQLIYVVKNVGYHYTYFKILFIDK